MVKFNQTKAKKKKKNILSKSRIKVKKISRGLSFKTLNRYSVGAL